MSDMNEMKSIEMSANDYELFKIYKSQLNKKKNYLKTYHNSPLGIEKRKIAQAKYRKKKKKQKTINKIKSTKQQLLDQLALIEKQELELTDE